MFHDHTLYLRLSHLQNKPHCLCEVLLSDLNSVHVFPQDQNVFDSKKKVKLTNAEGVEFKLAKKQLQAIDLNKALLAMYTNQVPV